MSEDRSFVSIQNVVVSASLGQKLDLESIVRLSPGAEYKPHNFPGVVYRLKEPKTATLIFSSGKMICAGANSERQAKKAVMTVIDDLKRNGLVRTGKPSITIRNVVASGGLGGYIDLEETAHKLKNTIYEPEQFPGLFYRMDEPHVVLLIFSNGKLVCVGARAEEEVYVAIQKIKDILEAAKLLTYP